MDDQKATLIYSPHLQSNLSALFSVKFLVSIFSGATAGVLGLTNLSGFLLFVASTVLSALFVTFVTCGGAPSRYFGDGKGMSTKAAAMQLLIPGMDPVWGFILSWTLFYGIIHVYD